MTATFGHESIRPFFETSGDLFHCFTWIFADCSILKMVQSCGQNWLQIRLQLEIGF